MPRRKRTNSSDSYSYKSLNKRRRHSLAVGDTQATAPFGSQGKLYKVRDIINEKGAKYLIDWEDDPETGEKYQPTWVSMSTTLLESAVSFVEILELQHMRCLCW